MLSLDGDLGMFSLAGFHAGRSTIPDQINPQGHKGKSQPFRARPSRVHALPSRALHVSQSPSFFFSYGRRACCFLVESCRTVVSATLHSLRGVALGLHAPPPKTPPHSNPHGIKTLQGGLSEEFGGKRDQSYPQPGWCLRHTGPLHPFFFFEV